MNTHSTFFAVLLGCLLMNSGAMIHAQTDVSYIGPTGSDNSWTNNANWTGGIAPTSTAFNAIINNGGNVFIPFTSIGLNNLTIGNGSTSGSGLMVDGLITLNNGATVGNNQLGTRTGINFGSSVTLSNVHGLFNGDNTLSATAEWTNGTLTFSNATASNSTNSIWNAKAGLYDSIGTGNTFSNAGTFHKNSDGSPTGGVLTIEPAFNQTSTGTLNVNAGELQLLGGGTHHGATNVLGGTTLNLAGTHTFADSPATLSVAADAVLQVSGGTTTIHTPYSHVGTAVVDSGGLLQLRGTATHTGAFQPGSGGTLEFGGNQTLNAGVSFAGSGTTSITGTVTTGTHLTIPTSFTHSGTLNSTHTIDLTGPATWSGGFIHNAGTTNALNSLTITGGRLNFGHTLNVGDGVGAPGSVQANWTSGNLDFRSSFFNVKADAVLTTTHNGTINSGDGTNSIITIEPGASFIKNTGTGVTTIGDIYAFTFHNQGSVSVNTGTLFLRSSGTHTGTWNVPVGATLDFSNGTRTMNAGTDISAAGTVAFSNGTTTFNGGNYAVTGTTAVNGGGAAVFNVPASTNTLNMSNGTLAGTASFTVTGNTTWSGGWMHNTGTTHLLGTTTLSGGTLMLNAGRTVNLGDGLGAPGSVQANWTSGNLDFRSSFFNVKADAVLTTTHNGQIASGDGTNSIITIEPGASFIKTNGTGITTIGGGGADPFTFNNQGSVSVNTGTLFLRSSGTHTGTWSVPVGATLDFSNGTRTMNAGTDISAVGTVAFSNGTTIFNAGNYAVTGTTVLKDGGAAVFNVPASTNALNMSNGTLAGTASFTVTGDTTWSGGWMHNTGTTHLLGTTTLSGGTLVLNAGRTVNLGDGLGAPGSVQANWTSGDININDSFLIVKADAVLTTTHNGNISRGSGSTSVVTIEPGASFIKTTGTGTTTIGNGASFTLNNQGTVSVNSGTLLVNTNATITQHSGTTLTGGTWNVSNGASISVASGSNITTIGSAASVTLDGAGSSFAKVTTALNNNQGSFTIKNNRDLTTAGAYTNSGTTRVEDSTTVMTIGSGGSAAYTQTGGVTALVNGAFIDASVFNLNGGTLQGTGTIESNVLAGPGSSTIAPGMSPGMLTINGNLTLSGGSTLAMELGGLTQGSLYDHLDVNGVLTLAGMLDLDFINDFQNSLTSGEILTLATANSAILGSFSNVASGSYLMTNYPLGLQVWYGAGSPFGAENLVVAVPEPSRALLVLGGLFGLCVRRRRPVPASA